MKISFEQGAWAAMRISLGWLFFWAFIDKVFGLGFATEHGKAWIDGVSPTFGYLKFATHGPFTPLFQALAGSVIVEWLFMLGLLLIGVALILGVGMRIAGYSGALMVALMFLAASLPSEHNPIIDEHVIYFCAFLLFTKIPVGHWLGFGKFWSELEIVKKYPILQ
ncbi:MAG TPA: hypothetical protein PLK06_00020 [bacterium]|nr:hypothetical protein [bacterium]